MVSVYFRRYRKTTKHRAKKVLNNWPDSAPLEPVDWSSDRRTDSAPSTFASSNDSISNTGRLGLTTLSHPDDTLIELVFVHGLGGDARKTWGTTDGLSSCWPADWLPYADGFEKVGVHTFGYDTKFLKGTGNCLNVHHIGKLLLGELTVSPTLRHANSKIIFVSHSMGGLVAKKTILLAKQDPTSKGLAERVAAVFFLACPHRGADSARLLRRVLKIAYDRQYIADLERNSVTTGSINDEFRHVAPDLMIWSFYETQKMKIAPFWTTLIVDEDSAILGYPNEKSIPMNADHKSICKFESRTDPNYLTILNSLAYAINDLQIATATAQASTIKDEARSMREVLGHHAPADDTLDSLREKRQPGTCDWLLSQDSFVEWQAASSENRSILWVSGKPGWGKSVLSSFVVDHLKKSGRDIHSFFFSYIDSRRSGLGDAVRSLTYQLAMSHDSCRAALLKLHVDGIRLEGMEGRPLWKTLLRSGVFEDLQSQPFWVVDGLDECKEPEALVETLAQDLEEASLPIRLLIVSRDLPSISTGLSCLKPVTFQHMPMSPETTAEGILSVVNHRISSVPIVRLQDRGDIVNRIAKQSEGSFLWVDLVIRQISQCHGPSEVLKVLEEMPAGMESVYSRILETMEKNTSSRNLAHAILSWVVSAARPLAIHELEQALEIDLGTTFGQFRKSIDIVCGQLVLVDQIGRITLQHETVKHFLLTQQSHPGFAFDQGDAHSRIAKACLQVFGARTFRQDLAAGRIYDGFAFYAICEFPFHLSKATTDPEKLLEPTVRFFKLHLLAWIAIIVKYKDLTTLNRFSENLNSFYRNCISSTSANALSLKYLSQVIVDLSKITYKFGRVLRLRPEAIHTIIPQFCPAESAVYRARKQNQPLSLIGGPVKQWDDALVSTSFKARIRTIASTSQYLILGERPSSIVVTETGAYQEVRRLDHGEEVEHLAIQESGQLMASSGQTLTKVWDLSREGCLIEFYHDATTTLGLEFDGDFLLAPRLDDIAFAWNLVTQQPKHRQDHLLYSAGNNEFLKISISVSTRLIAFPSKADDVTVVDLDSGEHILSCAATNSQFPNVLGLEFNRENGQLAVGRSTELIVLDTLLDEVLARCEGRSDALCSSLDGRMLASLDSVHKPAIVKLFDFETLRLLHVINTSAEDVDQLCFTNHGLHLIGIYGRYASQCIVWGIEQAYYADEKSHHGQGLITGPGEDGQSLTPEIVCLLAPPDEQMIICARADGTVSCYDLDTCHFQQNILRSSSRIRSIHWWGKHRAVLCVTEDNVVTLQAILKSRTSDGAKEDCLFTLEVDRSWIHDVFIAEEEGVVLISTCGELSYLYSDDGTLLATAEFCEDAQDRRFTQLPGFPGVAHCFSEFKGVQSYDLNKWTGHPRDTEITGFVEWPLRAGIGAAFFYQHGLHLSQDKKIAVVRGQVSRACNGPRMLIIDLDLESLGREESFLDDLAISSRPQTPETPRQHSTIYSVPLRQIIGILENHIVLFIDEEMWLSSLDLRTAEPIPSVKGSNGNTITAYPRYNRHFFVPAEVFKGEDVEVSCVLAGEDLVMALHGEPIIVKGFLEEKHEVRFDSYISYQCLRGY